MRKNPHGRILKREFKEQHLSTVPKPCSKNNYHEADVINFKSYLIYKLNNNKNYLS